MINSNKEIIKLNIFNLNIQKLNIIYAK